MATRTAGATQVNGVAKKPAAPRAAPKKAATAKAPAKKASPVTNKAYSVAGDNPSSNVGSAYSIMASRIAKRVAEMAENFTVVEREKPNEQPAQTAEEKKKPRKLEMRLGGTGPDSIAFSAPFLDNTLQKMLLLQNRMLKSTAELSKSESVDDALVKEHASQSAELSRIIALICAEKARQGA